MTTAVDHDQQAGTPHYQQPDWFTRNVIEPPDERADPHGPQRPGIPRARTPWSHHGRAAPHPGQPAALRGRRVPGRPRGETQWVRNVRHSGGRFVLILGRRRRQCTARELPVGRASAGAPRLPAQVGVRDQDVLRRRHPRLERRRVGRGGRPPSGVRHRLNPVAPVHAVGPTPPAWARPLASWPHGPRRRARGAQPHRLQPRADPVGQPRCPRGGRGRRLVRWRDLDPGGGQLGLPHQCRRRPWTGGGPRRRLLLLSRPGLRHQGARHR